MPALPVMWTSSANFSGALGSVGSVTIPVSLGSIPAMALQPGATLFAGHVGTFAHNFGLYSMTLTLPDTTQLAVTHAHSSGIPGEPNGGLYVWSLSDPLLVLGGSLVFTFTLTNVLGSPTVIRDNGSIIVFIIDGNPAPSLAANGGYGAHIAGGGGVPLQEASGGRPGSGSFTDPAPWAALSFVGRLEQTTPSIAALSGWSDVASQSGPNVSGLGATAIAAGLYDPDFQVFNPVQAWNAGSPFNAWSLTRNFGLTGMGAALKARGRSYAQIIG